jgi:hypothetical protein
MVENWAMILDNLVTNTVMWDGDTDTWQPPPEYLMEVIPEGSLVGVGWGWDGTTFTEPYNPNLDQPGSVPDVIQ